MAFFAPDGRKVEGRLASAGKGAPSDEITKAVAEAVGRCKNKLYKCSALKEMKALFAKYPQLKRDTWGVGEHPVLPLIDHYVKETLG